jgi:hypothetical protein
VVAVPTGNDSLVKNKTTFGSSFIIIACGCEPGLGVASLVCISKSLLQPVLGMRSPGLFMIREAAKAFLCYKRVDETVFMAQEEAFA